MPHLALRDGGSSEEGIRAEVQCRLRDYLGRDVVLRRVGQAHVVGCWPLRMERAVQSSPLPKGSDAREGIFGRGDMMEMGRGGPGIEFLIGFDTQVTGEVTPSVRYGAFSSYFKLP